MEVNRLLLSGQETCAGREAAAAAPPLAGARARQGSRDSADRAHAALPKPSSERRHRCNTARRDRTTDREESRRGIANCRRSRAEVRTRLDKVRASPQGRPIAGSWTSGPGHGTHSEPTHAGLRVTARGYGAVTPRPQPMDGPTRRAALLARGRRSRLLHDATSTTLMFRFLRFLVTINSEASYSIRSPSRRGSGASGPAAIFRH